MVAITIYDSGPVQPVWWVKGSAPDSACAEKDDTSYKRTKMHMEEKGIQAAQVAMTWLARAADTLMRCI